MVITALQKIGQGLRASGAGERRGAAGVRRLARLFRLAGGLFAGGLALLGGCGIGKLAAGQLSLINEQRRLETAIAEAHDPELRRLLAEVPHVRAFAREVMGLRVGKQYTGYYATSQQGMTYVVTASERTRLHAYTWWFPIAGTVEYRSYFDEDDARAAAEQLQARGYDSWVSPSRAYSTLGFFRDPVASTMLRDGLPGLVEVLLHELAHVRLYVPGHTEWNEALATFVGDQGAQRYFARERFAGTAYAAQMRARAARRQALDALVKTACDELESLYGSAASQAQKLHDRQPVFQRLERAVAQLYPGEDPALWRMNNARLVHFRRYSAGSAAVSSLWQQSGQRWRAFWPLAEAYARELPR